MAENPSVATNHPLLVICSGSCLGLLLQGWESPWVGCFLVFLAMDSSICVKNKIKLAI
jgi:hypothetical protein